MQIIETLVQSDKIRVGSRQKKITVLFDANENEFNP